MSSSSKGTFGPGEDGDAALDVSAGDGEGTGDGDPDASGEEETVGPGVAMSAGADGVAQDDATMATPTRIGTTTRPERL
jgi:hypothetical protein